MQHSHYYFQCRTAFFGCYARRYASAIVQNTYGVVRMNGNNNVFTVSGKRLIYGVIDYFIYQVMQAFNACITYVHGRALTHRFQSFQYLYTIRAILCRYLQNFVFSIHIIQQTEYLFTKEEWLKCHLFMND